MKEADGRRGSGRVSLRTIAEALGVSKMTVSLALRDHPRITAGVRSRVKAKAQELGYTPKADVSRLMSAIRKELSDDHGIPMAYITTGEYKGRWRESPTEACYWEGAKARAKSYGYYLEEYWLDEPLMSERRLSDILWSRGIMGVVIPPMFRTLTGQVPHLQLAFQWERFAVVTIGDMLSSPQLTRVVHDHYTSILMTMTALEERGYQRIGLCLTEHMDLTVNRRWQAGYRVYRANHPIGRIEPLILPDLSVESVAQWQRANKLDAIISAELRMPRFLREMGLEIGNDIGYADLDLDIEREDFAAVSGIVQNSSMLGKAAVDIVVSSLNRNQLGVPEVPLVMQVEGQWLDRGSTPRRA